MSDPATHTDTLHAPPARKTLLLVDDYPENLRILAEAIGEQYEVRIATGGAQALDLLAHSRQLPDLILLDVMMPEVTGHDVCRSLKKDPRLQAIPVVFLTASNTPEDEKLGFDLGAVDYITKPFRLALVLARIQVHLRLKDKAEQLERLAMIDAVTDTPNRRAFEQTLACECARALRDGTPLSLFHIDVDHFQAYTDGYGHGAGDQCLRQITGTLQRSLHRPGDLVCRLAGSEFAIVLPECDSDGAAVVAERLLTAVRGLKIPHRFAPEGLPVCISIGGCSSLLPAESTRDYLCNAASLALQAAKAAGRNRYHAS